MEIFEKKQISDRIFLQDIVADMRWENTCVTAAKKKMYFVSVRQSVAVIFHF